jgi:phosphoserine aminotransferase
VMMDYRNHIEAGSMLNTPPVFAVYVCMLTLRWLKNNGGIKWVEAINEKKSALLYNTIDTNPLFHAKVAKEDRSKMNVCFTIDNEATEKEFLAVCEAAGMVGVKGHRTSGGFRVSLYNALPYESVVALTDMMKYFAEKKG